MNLHCEHKIKIGDDTSLQLIGEFEGQTNEQMIDTWTDFQPPPISVPTHTHNQKNTHHSAGAVMTSVSVGGIIKLHPLLS